MSVHRIRVTQWNRSIIREYFRQFDISLGTIFEYDDADSLARFDYTGSITMAGVHRYLLENYRNDFVYIRKPGDPPMRYGPFKPIPKRLPA